MFTGIIQTTGRVLRLHSGLESTRLVVQCPPPANQLDVGSSLAVDGCCLTVVARKQHPNSTIAEFDLLNETLRLTRFHSLAPNSHVNLELPLAASARLDGHFVSGHIDATGTVTRWEPSGNDRLLEISAPPKIMRQIVRKGSVAINGISLTVAKSAKSKFQIWIIPHTLRITNLAECTVGSRVNIETDLLAKYVEKLIR